MAIFLGILDVDKNISLGNNILEIYWIYIYIIYVFYLVKLKQLWLERLGRLGSGSIKFKGIILTNVCRTSVDF